MRSLDESTRLAQAALRGFFDDPEGFARMDSIRQRKAVEAVRKILGDEGGGLTPVPGQGGSADVPLCSEVEVNVPLGCMPVAYGVPDGSDGSK